MTDPSQQILAAVLEWSIAMGADTAVGDQAIDWLAEGQGPPGSTFDWPGASDEGVTQTAAVRSERLPAAAAPRALARPVAPAAGGGASGARKFATAPPDVAVAQARSAARNAQSLEALREALQAFEGCSLKSTAKSLCFYRGAAAAPLMIIGDVPGVEEDREGRPIAGAAGRLLDRMLAAGGWAETDVHIASAVYWRPPGNRTPTPQEMEICRPFMERQIELVKPKILLLLGQAAAKQILRTDESILKVRGTWRGLEFGNLKVPAIASLYPEYLLRTPIAKSQAWRDILSVREALQKGGS